MKNLLLPFVITSLAFTACAAPPAPAPAVPTSAALPTLAPQPTATRVPPTVAPSPTQPPRSASIKEIVNKVDARPASDRTFANATLGQVLNVGGQARTGDSSKTRLDFTEGSVIRLGQNTTVTVQELTTSGGSPLTRLQFESGKLWIALFGGQMEIQTPVGVATVRGSYMFIECITQPIAQCSFRMLEGNGGVPGQNLGNLQGILLPEGTTFQLNLDDVRAFCNSNPDLCNALLAALNMNLPPLDPAGSMIDKNESGPAETQPEPPQIINICTSYCYN